MSAALQMADDVVAGDRHEHPARVDVPAENSIRITPAPGMSMICAIGMPTQSSREV